MKIEWYNIDKTFEVNNRGTVRRIESGNILQGYYDKDGYKRVCLSTNGEKVYRGIHRLVAQAFIPNPEDKPQVNHINSIRHDNRVENLEWATSSEDSIHAFKYGNRVSCWTGRKGALHPCSKKVLQLTLAGEIIAEYGSANEAARESGVAPGSIVNVCNGKKYNKTAGGYKWQYA